MATELDSPYIWSSSHACQHIIFFTSLHFPYKLLQCINICNHLLNINTIQLLPSKQLASAISILNIVHNTTMCDDIAEKRSRETQYLSLSDTFFLNYLLSCLQQQAAIHNCLLLLLTFNYACLNRLVRRWLVHCKSQLISCMHFTLFSLSIPRER